MTLLSRLGQGPLMLTSSMAANKAMLARVVCATNMLPVRQSSYFENLPVPTPAKIQLKPPPGEKGHMVYERYWSRDARFRPQMHGETLKSIVFYNIGYDYDLWIVYGIFVVSCSLVAGITIILVQHIELWIDRTTKIPPWDWSRVRDKYWKLPTILYDPQGATHQRIFMMEQIQDELLEAAKKRGTRE